MTTHSLLTHPPFTTSDQFVTILVHDYLILTNLSHQLCRPSNSSYDSVITRSFHYHYQLHTLTQLSQHCATILVIESTHLGADS